MRRIFFAFLIVIAALVGVRVCLLHQRSEAVRDLKEGRGSDAVDRLQLLAKMGDRTSASLIGSAKAYGLAGLPRDREGAALWLSRAERGCEIGKSPFGPCGAQAQAIADAFLTGDQLVLADKEEAVAWSEIAQQKRRP